MPNIKLLLIFLCGCSSFGIGTIGTETPIHQQQNKITDNYCTIDNQCGDGFVCLKSTSYVGVCAKIK